MITNAYLECLVPELLKYDEAEWIELKCNNTDHNMIGKNISSLANSAALNGKPYAYIIWGIEDENKNIVGSSFNPFTKKVGGEAFINWLNRKLDPKTNFDFYQIKIFDKDIVVLIIEKATFSPISFDGKKYIRVGSSTTSLSNNPHRESALWDALNNTTFEDGVAMFNVTSDEVLKHIDYPAYFDLLELPFPDSRSSILDSLEDESIIVKNDAGNWDITNFGAILFAKMLDNFPKLRRKAIRVINYSENTRFNTIKEQVGGYGYAVGFSGLIKYIMEVALKSEEIIIDGIRKTKNEYPELSIRELVANALIHQDFNSRGNSPMIEVFTDRIEITNPGNPIIDVDKIINIPPKSRNEKIASMMRRIGICEERGSGLDKIIMETEQFGLNAPIIEAGDDFTKVTVFYETDFASMSTEDRLRATYYHCCLLYANGTKMTNSTLRERFKVTDKSQISRLIKKAVEKDLIKLYDPETAPKYYQYIPSWR